MPESSDRKCTITNEELEKLQHELNGYVKSQIARLEAVQIAADDVVKAERDLKAAKHCLEVGVANTFHCLKKFRAGDGGHFKYEMDYIRNGTHYRLSHTGRIERMGAVDLGEDY